MPQSIKRRRARATAEQPSLWSYVTPTNSSLWGIPRAVRARMAEIAAPPVKIAYPAARPPKPPKPPKKRKHAPHNPLAAYERHLRRAYGITLAEYDAMLAAQDGVCAICGQMPPEPVEAVGRAKRYGRLAVDHDHATGKVRALLCANCNGAIGNFRDDTDVMLKAIGYVRRHRQAS